MQIKKIASVLIFTFLTAVASKAIATDNGDQLTTDQNVLNSTAEYAGTSENTSINRSVTAAETVGGKTFNLQELPLFNNDNNSSHKHIFETPYYHSDSPVRRRREKTFSEGAKGFIVGALQHRLQNKGFYDGTIDREFGPRTKAAVMAFQTSVNLMATGIVDKNTWLILMTDANDLMVKSSVPISQSVAPSSITSTSIVPEESVPVILSRGDKGSKVRTLQTRLNQLGYEAGQVDGIFGNKTKLAVQQFQLAMELSVNGIVDENTWRVLGEKY